VQEKTYKLCLDNVSTSGSLGGTDLFGFERDPTLSQRQDRLRIELSLTQEALSVVEILDVDYVLSKLGMFNI